MNEAVLETIALTYRYPDGRAALTELNLRIRRGERVALLGANGSGKTTLMLNLLGLLEPGSGEIRAFGESLSRKTSDLKCSARALGSSSRIQTPSCSPRALPRTCRSGR